MFWLNTVVNWVKKSFDYDKLVYKQGTRKRDKWRLQNYSSCGKTQASTSGFELKGLVEFMLRNDVDSIPAASRHF